jgi:hypothetical protein
MKNLLFLMIAFAAFSFTACDEDDETPMEETTGALELNFTLKYQDAPLVYFDDYYYEDSLLMGVSRVNMFFSNFFADDQLVKDVFFADFNEVSTSDLAAEGITLRIDDLPTGSYSNLSFGVGVPEDMNEKEPADFPADHPLSRVSEYWAGWSSYIFAKYEGNLDLTDDGARETGFTFHTGGEGMYRNLSYDRPFTIDEDELTEIRFEIELKEIFRLGPDEFLNLREIQGAHNEGDIDVMSSLSDNYSNAIRLRE